MLLENDNDRRGVEFFAERGLYVGNACFKKQTTLKSLKAKELLLLKIRFTINLRLQD